MGYLVRSIIEKRFDFNISLYKNSYNSLPSTPIDPDPSLV